MNYVLIMTEGSDEKALIDILLEKGLLIFKAKELLYEKPFHKRQIDDELLSLIRVLPFNDKVVVYRIGDKLSDRFDLRKKDIPGKIIEVHSVCTLPELEMLFIINEGYFEEYMKEKSSLSPSSFYKSKNKKYNKQASFVSDYFDGMEAMEIEKLLKLYSEKHGKAHCKGQYTLFDIIK